MSLPSPVCVYVFLPLYWLLSALRPPLPSPGTNTTITDLWLGPAAASRWPCTATITHSCQHGLDNTTTVSTHQRNTRTESQNYNKTFQHYSSGITPPAGNSGASDSGQSVQQLVTHLHTELSPPVYDLPSDGGRGTTPQPRPHRDDAHRPWRPPQPGVRPERSCPPPRQNSKYTSS